MDEIRVLLADDHTIVRKGLRSLLEREAGMVVVGEAQDGREAVELVEDLQPDVVVMDIAMPRLNGLEATRRIKTRSPGVGVVVLSMHTDEGYIRQLLAAGGSGYLAKQTVPGDLVTAIRTVHGGDLYLSPSIARKVVDEYLAQRNAGVGDESYDILTSREKEILQLIAESYSVREIAEDLVISPKTVESHRASLLRKVGANGTAELIVYAIRHGVIEV